MTRGHARTLMTSPVISIGPDTTLAEVAAVLSSQRIGGVPVVDAEYQVLGFVSDSDVMNAMLSQREPDTVAAALMSAPVVTVDEFDTTDDVMRVLREKGIHHVPVVRAGKLVGIITPADVIRFLATLLPQPPEAG